MTPCVMCQKEFEKDKLDFLGRCDECFKLYMMMPETERPKLSKPFVPIYNGKDKYGF
jgi:DNA-directed RNA polymerase subunit RPC12/RpoP